MATSRRASWRGLRSGDVAYLVDLNTQREELYDLAADPAQRENLAASRAAAAREWRERLCALLARPAPGGEVPIEPLPAEVKEGLDAGLRSLGYIGTARPAGTPAGAVERTRDPVEERARILRSLDCPVRRAP
jgi:hypothetical protein